MIVETAADKLTRLFSPKSIAFVGGSIAEMTIQRCLEMGYTGEIWPVHPSKKNIAGYVCYSDIESLPAAPDAAYIGVNKDLTIDIVQSLATIGAGGCVCYAAGFAEMGETGQQLQQRLISAAGDMSLIGPNTFGFINFMDRCALWPYLFGGEAVNRGPALISQSGNIAMNLTMNQRSVNFTYVIGTGNQAVMGAGDLINALLDDDRVTVIGMYVEGFDDIERFSLAAARALKKGVPIVLMKAGKTEASARQSSSHTSSLTGSDILHDALFDRLGVVRVDSLNILLETLKTFDLVGELTGNNILSLSCSGGEAAIIADLAPKYDLQMPAFSSSQVTELDALFGDYVTVSNPFDYNTSIWGDQQAQTQCFTAAMSGDHDAALLVYDHPTIDAAEVDEWIMALNAFIEAYKKTAMPAFVICTVSELLPASMRRKLIENGVVPLQGFDDGLAAYSLAAQYHCYRKQHKDAISIPRFIENSTIDKPKKWLDEWESKQQLASFGLSVPKGGVGPINRINAIADEINYPVVLKAVGSEFLHKSDMNAVALNLSNVEELMAAADNIQQAVSDQGYTVENFLVENMASAPVAELIVGIKRDDQFGPALVIGAGGILVELVADSVSLLLPTNQQTIEKALNSLSVAKLLKGFRGQPAGDIKAAVDAIMAIAQYAESQWENILELDVNPLLVLPEGQGVIAVDALISLQK